MIDLINEILATLRHNKLRTALTGFAVSWGIFLLIVLLSVSHGLVNGMNDMFSRHDTESITIEGGWAYKPYKGLTDGRKVQLRERDINLIRNRNEQLVTRISATVSNDSATVSTGKDYATGGYEGVYPSGLKSAGATISSGRFINDNDIRQARRVIVLHTDNAKNLFGKKDPIGKLVKINDLTFTVVGVFKHEWNTRSFIPYSTARNLSGGSDKIKNISVGISSINSISDGEKAEQDMYVTLGNEHNFDASDQGALWIRNYAKQRLTQNTASGALELAVWIISILTMLSGIVGVSNIMFVSVRERTHEIGVRRAIGARPLSILKQVILESVAITTIFGYVGIVLGVIVSEIINTIAISKGVEFLKNPSVDLGVAVQVTLVLIIAGAIAGLFPALKSLKINPVEALRDE